MPNHLIEFFEDKKLAGKIKRHLPFFYSLQNCQRKIY